MQKLNMSVVFARHRVRNTIIFVGIVVGVAAMVFFLG
jgi:hypothetical protein